MAEGEQDPEQKTEDPTRKRLEEAHKRGQVVTSREVSSFFLLLTLTLIVVALLPYLLGRTKILITPFIEKPDLLLADRMGLGGLLADTVFEGLLIALIPLFAALLASIGSSYLQHGHVMTVESMKPKLNRISPIAGWKRIFSMRSIVEFIKGLIKIAIVSIAIWLAVKPDIGTIKTLVDDDLLAILLFLSKLSVKLLVAVCVCMFFIAALDYMYQRYEFMKNMRMTKQEVKDEYKQSEGDPHVKQRLRAIRTERARKRMMAAVPQSDVVITNPTHYAVALKYTSGEMKAPTVVAKGIDFIALNIRKLAEEHDIPVVRNPPLARALYDNVDIDSEIPVVHYKAVAEVISYVYRLKGKLPPVKPPAMNLRRPK